MPWVDQNKCFGCQICIKECPAGAISMENRLAEIDMEKCIRCGHCHDICPKEAIRHDSEKISFEVSANIEKTKKLLNNFNTKQDRENFLGRMIKHYNKEIKVAENTITEIKNLKI